MTRCSELVVSVDLYLVVGEDHRHLYILRNDIIHLQEKHPYKGPTKMNDLYSTWNTEEISFLLVRIRVVTNLEFSGNIYICYKPPKE